MNKIVIDNNKKVEKITIDGDTKVIVECKDIEKEIIFNVKENSNMNVFDISKNTKNKIIYNVEENCNIIINKISENCSDNIEVNINEENSNINFYSSIINYEKNSYKQTINHNNKNSKSKIVNHCINASNNEFKFIVDGTIKRISENTIFNQDNKIINLKEGKSYILPNLIVDNDEIDASHSAYIGKFDDKVIFYLMTRGLSEKESNNLLIKSFLLNNMDLEENELEIFNRIIENIEI